jgi:hypothetical protein
LFGLKFESCHDAVGTLCSNLEEGGTLRGKGGYEGGLFEWAAQARVRQRGHRICAAGPGNEWNPEDQR